MARQSSVRRVLLVLSSLALLVVMPVASATDGYSPEDFDLIAGRNTDVGQIHVSYDAANLTVTYEIDDAWCMTASHLDVADDVTGIPQKNGNPIPGRFAYTADHDCVSAYSYTISLSEVSAGVAAIAAHAQVRPDGACPDPCEDAEAAWSAGSDFPGANWATYSEYTLESVLVDTVLVLPRNAAGTGNEVVSSVVALGSGVDYELKASGTYRFAPWGVAGIADAQCSYRLKNYFPDQGGYEPDDNGAAWVNGDDLDVPHNLEVLVGDPLGPVEWNPGACAGDHEYTVTITGTGAPATFTMIDSVYSDNEGYIPVEIWWVG